MEREESLTKAMWLAPPATHTSIPPPPPSSLFDVSCHTNVVHFKHEGYDECANVEQRTMYCTYGGGATC